MVRSENGKHRKKSMTSRTTLSPEEIERFDDLSDFWWDEKGPHAILHAMNICRLAYIKEQIIRHFSKDQNLFDSLSLLDVGCGGGIVCEPLTRLGASVTGIDASPKAIAVATKHAKSMNLSIDYRCTSIENMPFETYDVVLALEIIEHVENQKIFIHHCKRLLKPGGLLIVSTLNKTWKSYIGAIVGAEYVLRMVPVHTHDWNKFLTPSQISSYLETEKMHFVDLKGMTYSLLNKTWQLSTDLSINYIGCATF
jgi:2-polyprenyl-6-hydroxyphenyl methylase/3-demethylubiquinone-9 3-methyltransferase